MSEILSRTAGLDVAALAATPNLAVSCVVGLIRDGSLASVVWISRITQDSEWPLAWGRSEVRRRVTLAGCIDRVAMARLFGDALVACKTTNSRRRVGPEAACWRYGTQNLAPSRVVNEVIMYEHLAELDDDAVWGVLRAGLRYPTEAECVAAAARKYG